MASPIEVDDPSIVSARPRTRPQINPGAAERLQQDLKRMAQAEQQPKFNGPIRDKKQGDRADSWRVGGRKSWKKHQHKIARGERLDKEGRLDFTSDGLGSPQYTDKLRDRSGRDRLLSAGSSQGNGTNRQVQSNEGKLSITVDNTAAPSSGQYSILQRGRTNQSSGKPSTPGTPDTDGTVQQPLTQQGADQSDRRKAKKGQTKNKKKRVANVGDKQGNKDEPAGKDGDTAPDDIIPEATSPELIKLEKELEKEYIFRLKKRSAAFPSAKYFCRLCQYHCDTPAVCQRHIKESKSHRVRIQGKRANEELRKIPKPTAAQVSALTVLLETVEKEQGLLETDMTGRHQLADRVQAVIQKTLPDCKIQLYGSSLSGFALKTSNVNLDVSVPKEANPSEILAKVEQILAKEESFADVESNFSAKIPCISFKDRESGLQCILSTGNDAAISTCKLLATYARIDSRVRTLGLAFRYWARVCHLDCQSEGSMPPHAYIIMTVYFLQKHQPALLPVLHEAIPDSIHHTTVIERDGKVLIPRVEKNSEPVDVTSYRQTRGQLGALWLELLRYYSVDVELEDVVISIRKSSAITRSEKKWPHRRMAVEDPFSTKRNTAKSLNSPAVFDFLTERLKHAYMYFGVRKPSSGAGQDNRGSIGNGKSEKQDNTKHHQASPAVYSESEAEKSGQNFNFNYDLDHQVDSDDGDDGEDEEEEEEESSNEETVETIGSYTESMDTSLSDNNSTQPRESTSDLDMLIESVVENCLDSTTESCVESTSELEVTTEDEVTDGAGEYRSDGADSCSKPSSTTRREVTAEPLSGSVDGSTDMVLGGQNMSASREKVSGTHSPHLNQSLESCHANIVTCSTIDEAAALLVKSAIKSALASLGNTDKTDQIGGAKEEEKKGNNIRSIKEDGSTSSVSSEQFCFEFTTQVLTGGKRPVVTCSLCKKDGHLKDDCPDELKKELKPLPDLTPQHRELLDRVCTYVYETCHPPPTEYSYRDMILKDLESFIRQEFSGSHLCLFGSSMNGFGFKGSDLDICMTLEGHETSDDLDCIDIIERLAKILKKHLDLYNILPITTAKVPIVKFVHRPSKLEGDISLYNILAQYNTRMLNMYAAMDERVRILGYTVKRFAKICEIGDASRGSLSSYAYILMLLYFLQQRKPPIIPVLQELHDGQPKPEKMVDGWNAWFYDDLQSLPQKWPHLGENKETVGELWIGLLRFYTEEFNFREHVICIRQSAILTRFEKMWTSKCIAIEDPFDLNHNLGAGVSRKMNNFIIGAFIKGRETFGMTMRNDFLQQYPPMPYIVDYLFDAEVLTDGAQPPTDRCCRICGKIGHFMKDCPKRRTGKKEKKREGDHGGDQQRLPQRNNGPSRNNRTPGGRGTPQSAKGYYDRRNMMDHDPRSPPRGPYQPTPNQSQYRGSPHRQGGREDPPPRPMYQTPPQPVPFGRQGGGYYSRQRQNSREQDQYGRSPEGRMPLYARAHESPQFTSSPKTTSQPAHNPRGSTNYFSIPTMQYTNQQLTHHPRSANQQPTPSPPANQQFVAHTSSPNQQLGASPRSNQQLPMHHLANQVSPQVVQAQNRQLPQPRQNWGEVPQQVVMTTQGLVFLSPSPPHTYSAPFHISSSPPYQPHGAQPPR